MVASPVPQLGRGDVEPDIQITASLVLLAELTAVVLPSHDVGEVVFAGLAPPALEPPALERSGVAPPALEPPTLARRLPR